MYYDKAEEFMDLARNDVNEAWSAYESSEINYDMISNACYHIQQAIEKTIKACLLLNDVDVEDRNSGCRIHNISTLMIQLGVVIGDDVVEEIIPEWIQINSGLISDWEANTRYGGYELPDRRTVASFLYDTEDFVDYVWQEFFC